MDFDVLVLGTGLLESILSCQLSKKGLKVGHLDDLPFYGRSHSLFDDQQHCNLTDLQVDGQLPKRCHLEACPKLVYANGTLTKLLIDSKVGSYLEFKECNGIYIYLNDAWKRLPESKEDIFANETFSLIEKRKLMKFITATKDLTDKNLHEYTTFAEYLQSFNLGNDLTDMILYGIFLFSGTRDEFYEKPYESGIDQAKLYLNSIGRFCKSGFLAGMYGVGSELCQGFCRSSAVHGGTFMLNVEIKKIIKDHDHFKVITKDDLEFTSKKIIASTDFTGFYENCSSTFNRFKVCRSIHIFNYPLFPDSKTALFILPPNNDVTKSVLGIQMSSDTSSVPENHCKVKDLTLGVIYLFGLITREEMVKTIEFLFPCRNHIYAAVYDQEVVQVQDSKDENMYWCNSSDESIHDEVIASMGMSERDE